MCLHATTGYCYSYVTCVCMVGHTYLVLQKVHGVSVKLIEVLNEKLSTIHYVITSVVASPRPWSD